MCHWVMGSELGSEPEKVAQILESQAQVWEEKSLDTCIPRLWECL